MFKRTHFQQIRSRIEEPKRFIQVIMGPRQVGKTTLVTQLISELAIPSRFVSADAVVASDSRWLVQQWDTARAEMKVRDSSTFLLVIDEIQKITNWSETVKSLWDADLREQRELKVILLGSSRLLLQQGLTESLAGRFETTYMGHWSYSEMKAAFNWSPAQYVWYGGYPGSAALIENEQRWKQYVSESLIETSISKDILMLTRVDKPALMKRLFELGCAYSGQILSFTKIMGQLQDAGNTTTLSHYLELLNTAGLLGGLEKYDRKVLRQRSSSPKFQVHNTALMTAHYPGSFDATRKQPEVWGRWVESSIGAHLLNAVYSSGAQLAYWREGNKEVDFVLSHQGKTVAIEVKSGAAKATAGMKSFDKNHSPDRLLLVGGEGISWQDFLSVDPLTLF